MATSRSRGKLSHVVDETPEKETFRPGPGSIRSGPAVRFHPYADPR
jgi:hypothetical protein